MQRFTDKVSEYVLDHTTSPDELLLELERQTHLKVLRSRMVSGHLQGKVLEMISHLLKPKTVLELGTFTGYSALCLAKGLHPKGKLITIDINDELETFVQSFINRSAQKDQIEFLIGDARELVSKMDLAFDLVFIDADKRQYPEYYDLIIDKVKPGGFILADDVLWYGKVNEDIPENDTYTQGVLEFNDKVKNDPRVEQVLLPIRDGIYLIRKLELESEHVNL